jgi:hypothetical protein
MFGFVANFSDGAVRNEDFNRFLEAAEKYILNYSMVGGDMPLTEDEEDDEVDDEEEETDDF